jgi:hypothetical protein
MNIGKSLAIASMILSILASVGYFIAGDVRRGIYWLAAAVLTATVTL